MKASYRDGTGRRVDSSILVQPFLNRLHSRKKVPVADDIDGAAHVDVHEIHRNLLVQQLAAPRQRVGEPAADLGTAASQSAQI